MSQSASQLHPDMIKAVQSVQRELRSLEEDKLKLLAALKRINTLAGLYVDNGLATGRLCKTICAIVQEGIDSVK